MKSGRSQILSTIPVWPQPSANVRARLEPGGNRGRDCVRKKGPGPVISDAAIHPPRPASPPASTSRLGLSWLAPGAQPVPRPWCSVPERPREGERQEAVLEPVICFLPEPSWAGLLSCRLAVCGCVCARLNECGQSAHATAYGTSSFQGSQCPCSGVSTIST